MLRDRYEPDPLFWCVVKQLAIEMDPELAQIDRILEDEELFEMIKRDLSKRRPSVTIVQLEPQPFETAQKQNFPN